MPDVQPADAAARRRGPKGAGAEVRAALLVAAAASILEDGEDALSFRALARRAGVTPAMVPYYFGSRAGLLGALLERGFAPLLARLEVAAEAAGPLSPPEAQALLADLLTGVSEQPWLPALMLRSVLTGDELRDEFATRYAPRVAAAGARILARAPKPSSDAPGEALHEGLDPKLSLLSVLAMCVFPFLARPVVEQVFGLALDGGFARAQAAHITRLFAGDR